MQRRKASAEEPAAIPSSEIARRSVSENSSLQGIAAFGQPSMEDSAFPGIRVFKPSSEESSPKSVRYSHIVVHDLAPSSESSSREGSNPGSRNGSGKKKNPREDCVVQ